LHESSPADVGKHFDATVLLDCISALRLRRTSLLPPRPQAPGRSP